MRPVITVMTGDSDDGGDSADSFDSDDGTGTDSRGSTRVWQFLLT